jgi:hypothetical protein
MDNFLTFIQWLIAFVFLIAVLTFAFKLIGNYFEKKGTAGSRWHKYVMYIMIIIFAVCAWLIRH